MPTDRATFTRRLGGFFLGMQYHYPNHLKRVTVNSRRRLSRETRLNSDYQVTCPAGVCTAI